jgi:hypothetical protein
MYYMHTYYSSTDLVQHVIETFDDAPIKVGNYIPTRHRVP